MKFIEARDIMKALEEHGADLTNVVPFDRRRRKLKPSPDLTRRFGSYEEAVDCRTAWDGIVDDLDAFPDPD